MARGKRTSRAVAWGLLAAWGGVGCATQSPLPAGAYIREPTAFPVLPPVPPPAEVPEPPPDDPNVPVVVRPGSSPNSPLALGEVISSVEQFFPLILAVEQEREIAAGQRLSAEGAFDPVLKSAALNQSGTFANSRFDTGVEQQTPFGGTSVFGGWRLGQGNFPIYYGNRKTGQAGEFRTGVNVPLLQNREIDPQRAKLRAAQIGEQLADPVVRRARIDFFRNAAQAYWAWQVAGAQYRVAEDLLDLAIERQKVIDVRAKQGQVRGAEAELNRRLVANRRGAIIEAEQQLQQAAVRLSLFLRDSRGDPVVPASDWLLPVFIDLVPPAPDPDRLKDDVTAALAQRPELVRFQLEKERRAVELQLATNQLHPRLDVYAAAAQDVGFSKKTFTGTGPFATERTAAEVGVQFEMPLPLRNARGLTRTAQAQLAQLLARERYTRDEITAEVQAAVADLARTYERIEQARIELEQAREVLRIETRRFDGQLITLVELNIFEVAAAEAQVKVGATIAAYQAAVANYLAVLGIDAPQPGVGGCVLPATEPALTPPAEPELLPAPRPAPDGG